MEEHVSKRLYIYLIASGFAFSILFLIIAFARGYSTDPEKLRIILQWMLMAPLPILFSVIVGLCLIYKMWYSIQDGHARVTPGIAVGLLFIPLFNFYWVFRAVACFPKDYNNFVDRHELSAKKLEPHMFVAFSAFFCAANSAGLPLVVVWFILVSRICDAINAIPKPPAKERDVRDVSSHFRY